MLVTTLQYDTAAASKFGYQDGYEDELYVSCSSYLGT